MLAEELAGIAGIEEALVFGSWAARHAGHGGVRPVGDIEVLVLGHSDRDALYDAVGRAERRLGRPVQITVRGASWLESGSGSFHDTVISRPMLKLSLPSSGEGISDPPAGKSRVPVRAADAFPIAHAASASVIGGASGSKYWALCRVRRSCSKNGLGESGYTGVKLGIHAVLDRHVRPVASGRPQ